ncbi:MAG: HAD family hydrolase [Acidobacteria bacterium]|nr:HAD family hydrolase [Acidobacteriota bacterium]
MTGVIFDLDGTLLDTLAGIAYSANETLAANGLSTHPVSAYKEFVGAGVKVLFERAAPGQNPEPIIADFLSRYERSWLSNSHVYAGVLDMLKLLQEQNMPMAILSNKPQVFVDQAIQGPLKSISFRVALGHQPRKPLKPERGSADEAIEAIGLPRTRITMVGDTPIDIETAQTHGMNSVAVSWGFRPVEELTSADAICHSADELGAFLLDLPC